MITIKDYAALSHISYEAVRQQVKRYREELNGHIQRIGKTQYLDDDAVAILDQRRAASPVVVYEAAKDERIEELTRENEMLKTRLLQLQGEMLERDTQMLQLQEKFIALSAPQKKQSWIQRIIKKNKGK